jgi:hypothetical protein
MRRGLSGKDIELEMQNRKSFLDFLGGLLRINPLERWTPQQALHHPFITQKPFTEPFNPMKNTNPTKISDTLTARSESDSSRMQYQNHPQKNSILQGETPNQNFIGIIPHPNEFIKSNVDTKYNQVIGTFSEFQIGPGVSGPSSLPSNAPVAAESGPPPSKLSQSFANAESFPLRKTKSQYSVEEAFQNTAPNGLAFNSNFALNNHLMRQSSFMDGHPRHGDFGERQRIPSRMPSAAVSVDWEPFRDYDGSISGSLHFSRQSSFAESAERRNSLNYSSPGQQRKFQYPSRRYGSFSNESLSDAENRNTLERSDVFKSNLSPSGSTHNLYHSSHFPVKNSTARGNQSNLTISLAHLVKEENLNNDVNANVVEADSANSEPTNITQLHDDNTE